MNEFSYLWTMASIMSQSLIPKTAAGTGITKNSRMGALGDVSTLHVTIDATAPDAPMRVMTGTQERLSTCVK